MEKIYDVSLPIYDGMIVYPGDREVSLKREKTIEKDGYNWSAIEAGTHIGTHIDAPLHFVEDGKTMSDFPTDLMISNVHVVETDAPVINEEVLSKIDIDDWSIVFFRTKNQELWIREKTEGFIPDFVCLDKSGAEFLVEKKTRLVGIDYRSIEAHDSHDYPVHKVLLGNDTFIIEGLYLNDVPAGRYELFCLPLKLQNADGGPVRVILNS